MRQFGVRRAGETAVVLSPSLDFAWTRAIADRSLTVVEYDIKKAVWRPVLNFEGHPAGEYIQLPTAAPL